MSPFAHPLFTVLTGIGFGTAALSAERQHVRRVLLPLTGLLLAMGMHSMWNGSSNFGEYGFYAVYGAFMVPAFGLLTFLVIWTRQRELNHTTELPAYAAAGWLTPPEPYALGLDAGATAGARLRGPPLRQGGVALGRAVRGVRDLAGVSAAPGAQWPRQRRLRRTGAGVAPRAVAPPGGRPPLPRVRGPRGGPCRTGTAAAGPAAVARLRPRAGARPGEPRRRARTPPVRRPRIPPRRRRTPRTTPTSRRPQADASVSLATSASVRVRSATASRAGSCSTVRAEAMGAATVGRAASQARATVGDLGVMGPGDFVEGGQDADAALGVEVLARPLGARGVDRRTGRYLPVRNPDASAKYGTAARPVREATSWSGPSLVSRETRL